MRGVPRVGRISFPTKEAKARYMSDQARQQARLPGVRHWADRFLLLPAAQRAPAILRFVQYAIDYVRDPGEEVLEDADVTLVRGWGDCDAKEDLFVALCTACGIPAVGVPVFRGAQFPHEMAGVELNGTWYPVDPTIENSAIGQIPPYRDAHTNHWR